MKDAQFAKGLAFACLAFTMWGVLPLYWRALGEVPALHVLAIRILLSLALVSCALLSRRNFAWLAIFREPKKAGLMIAAAILICANWGTYIWAVNQGRTIEASLGYYINPLISIVLGLVFFKERLRPLQWAAVGVAFSGVLMLALLSGALPWVPLVLALSFGFYGLLKKKVALSSLESLGTETLASAPLGIALLFLAFSPERALPEFSGAQGLSELARLPAGTLALLALSGLATMLPLLLFGRCAKLLPLSTIGFTQFIGPTLQFLIGLFVFGEHFPAYYFAAFALIWLAVVLYVISLRKGKAG
ncbi:MAG: EamA family transporter RarD [Treponema sp.]|nr:EamA family transporter RarD [Treponema sp.]